MGAQRSSGCAPLRSPPAACHLHKSVHRKQTTLCQREIAIECVGRGGGEREGEGIAGTCCIWSIFLWLPGIRKMSCAVRRLATNDTRVQAHVR